MFDVVLLTCKAILAPARRQLHVYGAVNIRLVNMPEGLVEMPEGLLKMPEGLLKMPKGLLKMLKGLVEMLKGLVLAW